MLAAKAASAPTANACRKSSGLPAPPLATTGMFTAFATASVIGRSYPFLVTSASIEVRTISPAPSSATRRAQETASSPVGVRPPLMHFPDLPAVAPDPPRVDVDDRRTGPEPPRHINYQLRGPHGRGVDAHLLRTRLNDLRGVCQCADPAADGERHENLLRHPLDHVEEDG